MAAKEEKKSNVDAFPFSSSSPGRPREGEKGGEEPRPSNAEIHIRSYSLSCCVSKKKESSLFVLPGRKKGDGRKKEGFPPSQTSYNTVDRSSPPKVSLGKKKRKGKEERKKRAERLCPFLSIVTSSGVSVDVYPRRKGKGPGLPMVHFDRSRKGGGKRIAVSDTTTHGVERLGGKGREGGKVGKAARRRSPRVSLDLTLVARSRKKKEKEKEVKVHFSLPSDWRKKGEEEHNVDILLNSCPLRSPGTSGSSYQ